MVVSSRSTDGAPPSSARGELAAAILRLYKLAGKPSYRQVADLTRKDAGLPVSLSHDTVRQVIQCDKVPRWPGLHSVALVLLGLCVEEVDRQEEVRALQRLWRQAEDPAGEAERSERIVFMTPADKPDDGEAVLQVLAAQPLMIVRLQGGDVAEIHDYQVAMEIVRRIGVVHD